MSVWTDRKAVTESLSFDLCTIPLCEPNPGEPWLQHPSASIQLYLPLWIAMRLQRQCVCPRHDNQAPVVLISSLHGSPGAHDAVCWPEWEIVQVLMHGVEKSLSICNTRSKSSTSSNIIWSLPSYEDTALISCLTKALLASLHTKTLLTLYVLQTTSDLEMK